MTILVACALPARAGEAGKESVSDQVAKAIDSLRGVDLSKMSSSDKTALGQRLDSVWNAILDHPREAKPAVRAALAQEQADSFRIIDLSHLLVVLDPGLAEEAATGLKKADPNLYPEGYFEATSAMASLHCQACLPAVMRMLELKALNTNIPQHALPVDIGLGLTFTIGQYGDAALGGVLSGLESPDCAVRGNAALALRNLLPRMAPRRLVGIARDDACESARRAAWETLGVLDVSSLGALATARLEATPPPSREERLSITQGLGSAFNRAVEAPLGALTMDPDPDVSKKAKKVLEDLKENALTPADLRTKPGSAMPSRKAAAVRALEKARKKGFFEFDGERLDLLTAVGPADLGLLNEARAAVLARLSDECLDEYWDLTYIARALRSAGETTQPVTP